MNAARRACFGLGLAAVFAGALTAQTWSDSQSDPGPDISDDGIDQIVARVGYLRGEASFQRGDAPGEWQPLTSNLPLTIGDRVYVSPGGRAELQTGGTRIFVAGDSELAVLNLTEDVQQLSLTHGTVTVRVDKLDSDDAIEIDTPNSAVTLERLGVYRIYVNDDSTSVAVRRGEAHAAAAGGEVPLSTGDEMHIDGVDQPAYDVMTISRSDAWDQWVDSRLNRRHTVRAYDYVSPDVVGAAELDEYGDWQDVPEYGRVWSPRAVAADWEPYRNGRWTWQDPWGWTWISEEPWGWAPFHYGRWVYRSRWFWLPVTRNVGHVSYSPALVAFVGGGPGLSLSISGGRGYVGWFPLGPRDPFVPWWGRWAGRSQGSLNVPWTNRGHVTVVDRGVFVGGGRARDNFIRDADVVRRIVAAPVFRGPLPIFPTEASIRVGAAQPAPVARLRSEIFTRPVVARLAPPPAPPTFRDKLAVIEQRGGAPLDPADVARLSIGRGSGVRAAQPIRPVVGEYGRVDLGARATDSPVANPVTAPPGRRLSTPDRPFVTLPSGRSFVDEPASPAASGAVVIPPRVGPFQRAREIEAREREVQVAPQAPAPQSRVAPQPQPSQPSPGEPSIFFRPGRRVAPPSPDPLQGRVPDEPRPVVREQPREVRQEARPQPQPQPQTQPPPAEPQPERRTKPEDRR